MSLGAILISAVACGASLYQLRMASTLISAQTWPYVTIAWTYLNEQSGIVVQNDGLGPALIRDVGLKLDGRPQHDVVSALRQIVKGSTGNVGADALMRGVVIRPGNSANLILVKGAVWDTQMRSAKPRITVEMCYCSILERCWKAKLNEIPAEVRSCVVDTNDLQVPDIRDTSLATPLAVR
jgi:hypothetical protein